ncbi:MAG: FecR domain-containing protein [Dysgonamonadaceae bacterium]|jgi:ferric-dicitrate binding protein FerR (iron transport regulator)|nr:FecR domain-containing protein [Dysgonamonadaceae bacterium]
MKTEDIKITPKWSKSRDEIWNEVFSGLDDISESKPKVKRLTIWQYAAAAVIALMLASGAFAYLYTATETAVRGKHLAVTLPDGSGVNLNAESELTYKPYWWFASRDVRLKGEACFEVKPGSKFTVKSGANSVRVLGTSFNIFARADRYRVTCLTGKVEVTAGGDSVLLTPNMQASLRNGKLEVSGNIDAAQSAGWTQNKFAFIGVPLADVVQEIERQYDIHVTSTSKLDFMYTGNFSKTKEPEEALKIIGTPFGITFSIKR